MTRLFYNYSTWLKIDAIGKGDMTFCHVNVLHQQLVKTRYPYMDKPVPMGAGTGKLGLGYG